MSVFVDVEKDFGSFHLKVSFSAKDEVAALLGASGCGKSMTLRCIAGIERPDRGKIVVDGITLFDSEKRIDLSPQKRRAGLMFQNYALFPNMTVRQNIMAGARRERKTPPDIDQVLQRFGLTELADRLPSQISGGQQQRVALARILVSGPRILLLDEPFSALDTHLRFQMEQEVAQLIRQFGKTVLLVSHDRGEVFRLADNIVVMNRGRVDVQGPKHQVFAQPKTINAAQLTGCRNLSSLKYLGGGKALATDWGMTLQLPEGDQEATTAGVHMHDILPGPGKNSCLCQVEKVIENPFTYTLILRPKQSQGRLTMSVEKALWQPVKELEIHLENVLLLS